MRYIIACLCKKESGVLYNSFIDLALSADDHLVFVDNMKSVDIFETAMQNSFSAGKVLIDAVLGGTL